MIESMYKQLAYTNTVYVIIATLKSILIILFDNLNLII